jgi:Septum formation
MQYDPSTGEPPVPEDRRRDLWSSPPQSPMHGQPISDWPSQPGQPSGTPDPRIAPYLHDRAHTTGSLPAVPAQPPSGYPPSGGSGYGYSGQEGFAGEATRGHSLFDPPGATGEYAQPGWEQPSGWNARSPAGGDPAGQGWSATPAGGWQTGPQPRYDDGGPPTQAWATGERPALDFGQLHEQRSGQDAGYGYGQRSAQDYGNGSHPGQGLDQGYGRQGAPEYGRDYGNDFGGDLGAQDFGQAYGQRYGREYDRGADASGFDQGDYGRAGNGGPPGGYGQADYGHEQQPGGAGYPGYQTAADPHGSAANPGQAAWDDGMSYGGAGMGGGVATQGQGASLGTTAGDPFADWSADGGWGQADRGGPGQGDPYLDQRDAGPPSRAPGGPAVGALIAALVGLVIPVVPAIVALVLAARAGRRIKESGGAAGGKGMVVAARVIAIISLVLAALGVVIAVALLPTLRDAASDASGGSAGGAGGTSATAGEQNANAQPSRQGTARIVSLNIGDCIADTPKNQVTEVKVVPCSTKHETEVFANIKLTQSSLPAEKALDELAEKRCVSEFKSYVGTDYNSSDLNIRYFTPTEDSWNAGDRTITCTLTGGKSGEKLTGSKRESKE